MKYVLENIFTGWVYNSLFQIFDFQISTGYSVNIPSSPWIFFYQNHVSFDCCWFIFFLCIVFFFFFTFLNRNLFLCLHLEMSSFLLFGNSFLISSKISILFKKNDPPTNMSNNFDIKQNKKIVPRAMYLPNPLMFYNDFSLIKNW